MSGVPGFSISDLISAVAWSIEFIIALKSVRGEVKELQKSLEKAKSELNGLEDVLEERRSRLEGPVEFRTAALDALRTDLHGILNDIFSLLSRFDSQGSSKSIPFSSFRRKVIWVVDSRYAETVKGLLRRLSEYKQSVHTELLLCIHHYQVSTEHRRESVPVAPVPTQPTASALTVDGRARIVSSPSPTSPIIEPKRLVISTAARLPPTKTYSIACQLTNTLPSPPPTPPVEVLPISAHIYSYPDRSTRSSILPPYTSPHLLPDILRTTGSIKVWFQYQSPTNIEDVVFVPYSIKTITILRDSSGNFRGVHSTRFDNAVLEHELPSDKFFLTYFNHPLPIHSRQVRDLKKDHVQASNYVSFLRDVNDSATMIPDYYSFSAVEDYRLFQNNVVGGSLLIWFEVKSISTEWSPTPICESQILQVWDIDGVRKIHFFRNGKDRQYSQHSVSSLRDKKKSLKSAQKEGLKLVFERTNGSPTLSQEELKMVYLFILFTKPEEISRFLEEAGFS